IRPPPPPCRRPEQSRPRQPALRQLSPTQVAGRNRPPIHHPSSAPQCAARARRTEYPPHAESPASGATAKPAPAPSPQAPSPHTLSRRHPDSHAKIELPILAKSQIHARNNLPPLIP